MKRTIMLQGRRGVAWGVGWFIVLLPLASARADLSWQITTTTIVRFEKKEEQLSVVRQNYALKENVLRIDDLDEGGVRFYNFQIGTAVFLYLNAKTFEVLSFEELIAGTAQQREELKKELARRESRLSEMDPEEREAMAAQIQGQKKKYELWSRPYDVVVAPEKAVFLGHPCQRYLGRAGGEIFQDLWVSQDITLPETYKNYFAPSLARIDPQEYSHLPQAPGFVMKLVSRYGQVNVTQEVSHLSFSRIPLEAFLIPVDFRPVRQVVVPP